MADRSNGDEKNDVRFHPFDLGHDGWKQFFAQTALRIDATHEGEGVGGERTDLPSVDKVSKRVKWEDSVGVDACACHVVGEVARAQIVDVGSCRDRPIRSVVLVMERDLTDLVDAAGPDERDLALAERLGRLRECGRVGLVCPAIRVVAELGVAVFRLLDVIHDVKTLGRRKRHVRESTNNRGVGQNEWVDTERFVELPDRGVTLCVARGGSEPNSTTGRPLVVVNGTGSDLRNAPNALRWPIAKHFEILVHDHRCLGRSEQHVPDYQPTMADFALDILALCDAEGIDDFDMYGNSFGGMVAQEVAILAGDRVVTLVLSATSSGGPGSSSYPLHELYENGQTMEDIPDLWDTRTATDPVIAAQVLKIRGTADKPVETPPGLLRQVEARRHHDTWDRLEQIAADTLVVCGEFDGVAPPDNSRRLAQRIPGAELASFDGGHHYMWQDRSAWPHIIDFLQN